MKRGLGLRRKIITFYRYKSCFFCFLQISNHIRTILLQFYILQFFLQFHYSANFLEIVCLSAICAYCETKLNINISTCSLSIASQQNQEQEDLQYLSQRHELFDAPDLLLLENHHKCTIEIRINIVFTTYLVFLSLLLLSSLAVMMNFEELIKTAICEFSKKNSRISQSSYAQEFQ